MSYHVLKFRGPVTRVWHVRSKMAGKGVDELLATMLFSLCNDNEMAKQRAPQQMSNERFWIFVACEIGVKEINTGSKKIFSWKRSKKVKKYSISGTLLWIFTTFLPNVHVANALFVKFAFRIFHFLDHSELFIFRTKFLDNALSWILH